MDLNVHNPDPLSAAADENRSFGSRQKCMGNNDIRPQVGCSAISADHSLLRDGQGLAQGAAVNTTTGYIALVHKDKGTSYGVNFPDVPGCISAGDTFEGAIDNAAQALAGHLAIMEADGDPIPNARSLEELKQDAEFVDDSIDAVVAFVEPQDDQVTTLQPAPQPG
jgi:predicted RNase H-like HicB family nuclease